MTNALQPEVLDQLFRMARTPGDWEATPVADETIRALYDLFKWGPTSGNTCPARFVWVRSAQAKAQLAGLAMERNRPKILAAPLTVIVGNDLGFAEAMPKLNPVAAEAMQKMFAQPGVAEVSAMRNASLQGAYLMIAARALGLDCGPMSGFDNAGVDRDFFAGTKIQSNFICCLGVGKHGSARPRNPRLSFEDAGRLA